MTTKKQKSVAKENFLSFLAVVATLIITTFAVVLTIKTIKAIFTVHEPAPIKATIYDVGSRVICDENMGVVIGQTDKRNIVRMATGADYIGTNCEQVLNIDCDADEFPGCLFKG